MASALDFVSLGMVILDEIHLNDGQIYPEVLGGSGAYGITIVILLSNL
jgi:hypothetical protein